MTDPADRPKNPRRGSGDSEEQPSRAVGATEPAAEAESAESEAGEGSIPAVSESKRVQADEKSAQKKPKTSQEVKPQVKAAPEVAAGKSKAERMRFRVRGRRGS